MIHRIDVRPLDASADAHARSVAKEIAGLGLDAGDVTASRVFFVDGLAKAADASVAATQLLADPVTEAFDVVTGPVDDQGGSRVEIHLKPGVMDPVAGSTEAALADLGFAGVRVRTGRAYRLAKKLPDDELRRLAVRVLANGVIESVHLDTHLPTTFAAGHAQPFKLRHAELLNLDDDALKKLSRNGHLFLSLAEMKAVQAYFHAKGREPTDIELETVAQTWSEHCVHKTLKSAVEVYDESGKHLRSYRNLIKETIFGSTMELVRGRESAAEMRGLESRVESLESGENPSAPFRSLDSRLSTLDPSFCLSVFKDNAGVVVFDDVDAVCIKVETHNRPSAIEPYGGAATGIGGCIRDILGTGLGARPVANTNVFCVAFPGGESRAKSLESREQKNAESISPLSRISSLDSRPLPKGVIHPKRVLQQVVAGVRDYGNRMGIPTVNGAVYFDDRYIGNPLVFAGCVGILPRDKIDKQVGRGDAIVVMGGRTGRDGIHGATFSSAELTTTHADEFSHAVQIGNAITQKQLMDVLLQARDLGLYTAVTDCGAGGLSSAIGEMGGDVGATVELDKVTLKYAGLRYDEIWISEAQERMVLSVPPQHVPALLKLSADENVESTVIGTFGTDGEELILQYHDTEVGRMEMAFLHDGIPMPVRRAVVGSYLPLPPGECRGEGARQSNAVSRTTPPHPNPLPEGEGTRDRLLATLAHPTVASKHWIIRQYDHEVQGGSVIKPLVGPLQMGPSDASVVRPKSTSLKGVAVACGLAPAIEDPYEMALASIDEALRNVICVGGRLNTTALLDNFCWPGTDDEGTMGTLVRACEACRDAALAFGVPFISGKDSLHNQFTNSETGEVIRIPRTLLISALSVIDDVRQCVTMDLKAVGSTLAHVRPMHPHVPLAGRMLVHQTVETAIARGWVNAAHDVSDGGLLCAAAEMAIAADLGLDLSRPAGFSDDDFFAEPTANYLLELDAEHLKECLTFFARAGVAAEAIAKVTADPTLLFCENGAAGWRVPVADLRAAWRGTLDW